MRSVPSKWEGPRRGPYPDDPRSSHNEEHPKYAVKGQ